MNPDLEKLTREIAELRSIINYFVRTTDYQFVRPVRGGPDGLRLSTSALEKIGFFDSLPIAQWNSGTGRQDIHDNSGAAAQIGTRYTGNVGVAYYSIGDVVAALKGYGLLDT